MVRYQSTLPGFFRAVKATGARAWRGFAKPRPAGSGLHHSLVAGTLALARRIRKEAAAEAADVIMSASNPFDGAGLPRRIFRRRRLYRRRRLFKRRFKRRYKGRFKRRRRRYRR